MRRKEKTTILLVNKGAHASKPLHISSNLVMNWKKYVAALSLFFLVLVAIIIFLVRYNIQQYRSQRALAQKLYALSAEVDTNALRKKLTNINDQLSTINSFLNARGIKSSYKMPQGVNADSNFSAEDIADFYQGYLNGITYNISYTPIGMPYRGPITSSFGQRENPFGGGDEEVHKGLDIKGPMGGEVKAMAKGVVEFAGQKTGFGNCIVLKHGNGFETLYGHLSKILVRVGDQIDIGERIGLIGSTGRSTGPHLHYEVHRYGKKIDPESFLNLN
jgi:murein DD-endopeptidase MepM/ murein hydrolase activator NlpD